VYQFFPNKQAIIFKLYQDWLGNVTERLKAEVEQARGEPDWRRFASRLAAASAQEALDRRAEYELLRAMWSRRELIDLDRAHTRALAEVVAESMRRYGATVSGDELVGIATFANELHTLVAEHALHCTDAEKVQLDECARVAYLALWGHALAKAVTLTIPLPAARSRRRASPTTRGAAGTDRKPAARRRQGA
jgi:AcrR family transcriptional regulator